MKIDSNANVKKKFTVRGGKLKGATKLHWGGPAIRTPEASVSREDFATGSIINWFFDYSEFLALDGQRVTTLELLVEVASDMESRTRKLLMKRLDELKVNIITNTRVTAVQHNKIFYNRGKSKIKSMT
jgi:hypothetical protein